MKLRPSAPFSRRYRFTGDAGEQMPESPPGSNLCGTAATGWLSSSHPDAGSTIDATVCFGYSDNDCQWSASVAVSNCGGYYVYYLEASERAPPLSLSLLELHHLSHCARPAADADVCPCVLRPELTDGGAHAGTVHLRGADDVLRRGVD